MFFDYVGDLVWKNLTNRIFRVSEDELADNSVLKQSSVLFLEIFRVYLIIKSFTKFISNLVKFESNLDLTRDFTQ